MVIKLIFNLLLLTLSECKLLMAEPVLTVEEQAEMGVIKSEVIYW